MTNTKHTPGPLEYHDETGSIYSANGERIGIAYGDLTTEEEDAANGRLWAASPELLKELKDARDLIRGLSNLRTPSIDAAIAKATGEQA